MMHFADLLKSEKNDVGEFDACVTCEPDKSKHSLLDGGKVRVNAWPTNHPDLFAITVQPLGGEQRHIFCKRGELQAIMLAIGQALAETESP